MLRPPRLSKSGFSLVEIALAIGIIAFAFVALMSLMPAGLTTFRRALDITICTQIAQKIVAEAQQQDFDVLTNARRLPAFNPGQEYAFRSVKPGTDEVAIRYFDEQGNEVVPLKPELTPEERLRIVYWVNMRIVPRVVLPTGKEGFPADAKVGVMGNLAHLTVQVARNPTGVELPLNAGNANDGRNPERLLWKSRPGIEIFTYSAYVGRNL